MSSKSSRAKNPTTEANAKAFFNKALDYQRAANELFDVRQQPPISDPVNFPYFHSLELALKAFLRSRDLPVPSGQEGHRVTNLHAKCLQVGLVIGPVKGFDAKYLLSVQEAGNEHQAFRYFYPRSRLLPLSALISAFVEQLMQAVKANVEVHRDTSTRRGFTSIAFGTPKR